MCLFCFWLPSVTEGLYVNVLFYEGCSVFETVLSWREGAWSVPLLRFAGGDKWRRLRGRWIPAASCRLVILHLWNDTELKTGDRWDCLAHTFSVVSPHVPQHMKGFEMWCLVLVSSWINSTLTPAGTETVSSVWSSPLRLPAITEDSPAQVCCWQKMCG